MKFLKNPNKCRNIMFILVVIGTLFGIISVVTQVYVCTFIGLGIAFAGIIFGIITVRCPYCKTQLHLRGLHTSRMCPKCKRSIDV